MAGTDRLTTTSYAILGQLALRPWTTYELAAEMRRNLHYFWPRAESLIYAEVKRLALLGLATARREAVGRRRRTIYSITPAGEATLQAWLNTTPTPMALECEGLLRVLLAPLGSAEQVLAAVEHVQRDAEELLGLAAVIRREYLAGRAPFQAHVHARAHVYDALLSHALTWRDWAVRAAATVRTWEQVSPEERTERALAIFAREIDPETSGATPPATA
jgi:PadR family transcriptional regulator, regulatory protein AphA